MAESHHDFDVIDTPPPDVRSLIKRDGQSAEGSVNIFKNKPISIESLTELVSSEKDSYSLNLEHESHCTFNIDTGSENIDGSLHDEHVIDGLFTKLSITSSFSFTQMKIEEERKDIEGIVFKHTSFYPKPLKKEQNLKITFESDLYYDMTSFPRGKMTIINVKFFQKASGMAEYPRHGTDRDADNLCKLFVDLGFIVDRYDNPTRKDILSILKAASSEDYSRMSCCACAVLTHGEEGILYGTDDFVKIRDITKLFRTKSLANKPKFFLFQACQGSEYMDPIDSVDGPGSKNVEEKETALTLPSESDFIYAYSTVPGYYSWRNSTNGSWFMESLCAVFRKYAHKMDVLRMLTRVNAVISQRKSKTNARITDNKRQISSIVTQLRKEFFMMPPHGPLEPSSDLPDITI